MNAMFERNLLVLEEEELRKIQNSHVMVFGLGGVGGYVVEMLTRAGVGEISIVDYDVIDITNKNRQIIALDSTIGQYKTDLMEKRMKDINPMIIVNSYTERLTSENMSSFFEKRVDYVVDAIDTLTSKLALIVYCTNNDIPIISSMGTGNKLDPTKVEVTDIYKTDTDPMAKIMRKELKNREVKALKVVFSREIPTRNTKKYETLENKRKPGSLAFVPATAGITLAYQVIVDILKSQML